MVKLFLSLKVGLELSGHHTFNVVAIRGCPLQISNELHLLKQLLSKLSLLLALLVQLDQRLVQLLNQSCLRLFDGTDLSEELLLDAEMRVPLASYESIGELVFLSLCDRVFRLGCLQEFSQRVVGKLILMGLLVTFDLLLRFLEDFHVCDARVVDDFLKRAVQCLPFLEILGAHRCVVSLPRGCLELWVEKLHPLQVRHVECRGIRQQLHLRSHRRRALRRSVCTG